MQDGAKGRTLAPVLFNKLGYLELDLVRLKLGLG